MANRDILVLNTTQSRAETQQTSDTVRIKGGGEILSIENSSASPILTVQSSGSQTTLEGKITSTGNITGVVSASFGKVIGTTLIGSAFELTDTDLAGTLSSSAQIASRVTGSFRQGFEFTGTISGSGGSTGSFDRIVSTTIVGDASNLTRTDLDNTISGSAQIAADISGSFTSGFEFTGQISGSATTTGSFGSIVATTLVGSAANLTNADKTNTVTGSAQLASGISGSFNKGFEFDGEISASISGSASFTTLTAQTLVGDGSALTNTISTGTVTGSAQLASAISGSFTSGFEFDGKISGSVTSTGSFGKVIASEFVGDGTNITNVPISTDVVSGSAQLASRISGSFTSGFEFSGAISGSATSTGSFGRLVATTFAGDGTNLTNTDKTGTISSSAQLASRISGSWSNGFQYKDNLQVQLGSWSAGGNLNQGRFGAGGFGNKSAFIIAGGRDAPYDSPGGNPYQTISCVESYDGSSWSEVNNINLERTNIMAAGTTTSGIIAGGFRFQNSACGQTETWNGTNWSETGDMLTATGHSGDAGTSADTMLTFGGATAAPNSHYTDNAEEYNGSSWSEISELNEARTDLAGLGTTEAALAVGGSPTPGGHAPGNGYQASEWNGSNWSAISNTLTHCSETYLNAKIKGAGTVNDGHAFAGGHYFPSAPTFLYDARSQHWDGTSWTYGGRLITGRGDPAGNGDSGADALAAGGANPSDSFLTSTEHYNALYATASFGTVIAGCLSGEANQLDNVNFPAGTVSSSAQIASDICGSFNKGFEYTGEIRTAKGVWSTGGNLVAGRNTVFSAGTADAALAAGGSPGIANSEEYNGTAWTEGNNMITARTGGGAGGTQNAAVLFGGADDCTCTEEYNGTSYASAGAMNLGRFSIADGNGTQNASLAIAGYTPAYTVGKSETELYDGSTWSEVADVNLQRGNLASAGTANATVAWDGYGSETGGHRRTTEIWDGSSWSIGNPTVGTLVYNHAGSGTVNAAFHVGGIAASPDATAKAGTEHFDGNVWSIDGNLNIANQRLRAGSSTQANGLVYGGSVSPSQQTEEFNAYFTTGSFGRIETPDVQIAGNSQLVVSASLQLPVFASNTGIVSSSAGQMWFNSTTEKLNFTMDVNSWSAGGDMVDARTSGGGAGIQNAAIAVAGTNPAVSALTEVYDGSAWSEVADLDVATRVNATSGTSNAALNVAGLAGSPEAASGKTEGWDGATWSETPPDVNTNKRQAHMSGTANASLHFGGFPNLDDTEEWNGTAWTTAADMNQGRSTLGGSGTQNATIAHGGRNHPSTNIEAKTELYDGTSWSEVNDLNAARQTYTGGGTQNAAVAFGGSLEPSANTSTCTEEFNGTSWSIGNAMGTAGGDHFGGGSQAAAWGALAPGATLEYNVSHLKTVEIDGV